MCVATQLIRVWGLKKTNPNAALTDIPASTLAYLTSRGLEKNAQAILSGHPATDDPALFNKLHRLASEDPVKFAQTSLITSSGQLSQAHMDYLQGLQDAINKQDPQAIAANTQVNDAVQIVSEEMKLTGINLNPEPGAQEKLLAKVETGLRDRIIAAQQAKNGTPLTSDEVKNLAMGYFADQMLKTGGMLAKSGDDSQPQAQGGQHKGAPGTPKANSPQLHADSTQPPGGPITPPTAHGAPAATSAMVDAPKNQAQGSVADDQGSSSFDKDAAVKNINSNAKPKFTGFCGQPCVRCHLGRLARGPEEAV